MAKKIDGAIGFVEASSANYIKQIFDGSVTHDIAVEKGITFYNGGKDGATAFTWDGTQKLEVVIPTLADIVANPVVLKGILNSSSEVPSKPSNGDLYYIGTTGSYFDPAVACEAGDMAIYYDKKWNVISGENQIQLVGGTIDDSGNHSVVLSETAANVINVEGKDLSLSVNYADILGKITADGNGEKTIALSNGKTTISGKYLTLSSTPGVATDITKSVSIDLPTALASGDVTISNKVLVSDNFTFTSGSFPTIKKNDAAITVNASHKMTIAASGSGDFVTGVDAIKSAKLVNGDSSTNDIAYVAALSAVSGKSFVSGIHAHGAADADKTPDFTVPGVVTADASVNTFVTGVEDSTSGLVSSITVGAVTGKFVTGLSKNGTSVLTSVSFGDAELDTGGTRKWFVTGLEGNAKAVTDVNFGSVVVTPQTSSAIVSASVNNHVLSFNTGNFMTSATAALSGTGVTTKAFTKGGVKLSGFEKASDTLKTGSVSQAETTISYKSLKTGAVTLSQGVTGFHFDKEESDAYSPIMGYKKVEVVAASTTKSGAVLQNTAITANIPAEQVVVGLNVGTLPSLTIADPTGELAGTVGTELTKVSKDWLAVDPDKKMIAGATTWSLVESSDAAEGSIGFAKAGTYDVSGDTEIEKDSFIAAVKVSGTSVPTTPAA